MLTEDDLKYLRARFLNCLTIPVQIAVLGSYVPPEAAAEPPPHVFPHRIVGWILDEARKAPVPRYFLAILDEVEGNAGALPPHIANYAAGIRDDLRTWEPLGAAGTDSRTLEDDPDEVLDGGPFVDRASFRGLLPRGAGDGAPLTIVVQGGVGAGKSYLHEFCRRLRDHWGDELRVGYANLDTSSVRSLSPRIPAYLLAGSLGTDRRRAPRRHEDPHRYASNLATWILTATPESPLPALALLDGFDHPQLPDPLHTFVLELARGLQQDPQAQGRMRLVLLGYDTGRLERDGIEFERCVLEHVDRAHLDAWFRARYPGRPDYAYEDVIDEILGLLPPDGPERMKALCTLVRAMSHVFSESP